MAAPRGVENGDRDPTRDDATGDQTHSEEKMLAEDLAVVCTDSKHRCGLENGLLLVERVFNAMTFICLS